MDRQQDREIQVLRDRKTDIQKFAYIKHIENVEREGEREKDIQIERERDEDAATCILGD